MQDLIDLLTAPYDFVNWVADQLFLLLAALFVRYGVPVVFLAALAEATEYFNAIAKKENDDSLEDIKKTGKVQVYTLTPQERRSWVEAVLPVHKDMEKRIGKDTIAALYKVVDFKPA